MHSLAFRYAQHFNKPEEYNWSSHNSYIKGKEYTWLDKTLVLDAFGGEFGCEKDCLVILKWMMMVLV